ncbi:hypothetical protein ColKHC_11103 [Colletotrichum higginsianum]|nr:hypothetical protein ColKHC_11103 [Colletotrichum higginsianum]
MSDQRRYVQSTWDEVYWNTADYGPDEGVHEGDAETTTDEDDANPSQRIGHSTEDIDRLLDEYCDGIDDTCSSLVIQAASSLGTDWRVARPVSLHLLEPWKEFFLTHFSEAIAPEMVVIDDRYNGWRHLILPVARSDDMVMAAVLAASAFHVSARAAAGPPVIDPERLYARAIGRLSERRDLAGRDAGARQLVILAIVVLLVSVMVNGLPDFPIVFQMLESAIDAVGGEEVLADGGEMGGFLGRQIRKMRVYAAPLVSEAAGVDAIVHHARGSFDCLYYYHSLYPNHRLTFDLIAGVRQQAFDMYLRRVLPDDSEARPAASPEDEPIQSFRRSLESFPEGALGSTYSSGRPSSPPWSAAPGSSGCFSNGFS